jgi:tetratricopeptide (TPR) repeat protein
MADRYTYIPLIGPVISLVWLGAELAGGKKHFRAVLGGLAILTLAACLIQTRHQLQFWKDTDTLFTHTIEVTGENPRAEYVLGLGLEQQGRLEEAMVHYRNAVSSQPRVRDAFIALGRLLGQQGRWAEAEQVYATMLVENPKDFYGHLGLATTLPHLGRTAEAEPHLKRALQTCPDTADALNNLAWTLATNPEAGLRDGRQAVELAKRACALTDYRETIMVGTLGAAYAEAGQFDQAIATAQQACALASAAGKTELLNINRGLLERYRQHQAYREAGAP